MQAERATSLSSQRDDARQSLRRDFCSSGIALWPIVTRAVHTVSTAVVQLVTDPRLRPLPLLRRERVFEQPSQPTLEDLERCLRS